MTDRNSNIYDCFLYNNETELLEIRLALLSKHVEKFVIVAARQTFTGIRQPMCFPWDRPAIRPHRHKIQLIELERLVGRTAWEREAYARNALAAGLQDAHDSDIVMVSDVDEIPHPDVVASFQRDRPVDQMTALGLDYFNFKLNYRMILGQNAVWAGPVVVPKRLMTTPQDMRSHRWDNLHKPSGVIWDAGWHFSYMTKNDDVAVKLRSFSHQNTDVQSGGLKRVSDLIARREGFVTHFAPCEVWAVVGTGSYGCSALSRLVETYPELLLAMEPDSEADVSRRVRLSVNKMAATETHKLIRFCSTRDMRNEVIRRLKRRLP